MKRATRLIAAAAFVLALTLSPARADDVRSTDQILCTAVHAAECWDDGECVTELPSNLGMPQFVEIDLAAKKLATTKASGVNRATSIEFLRRQDSMIVLQGFERGRAFSFVITEEDGRLTGAVATEGRAVSVFGACTPSHPAH